MKPFVYLAVLLGASYAAAQTASSPATSDSPATNVASVSHQIKAIHYRNGSTSKIDMQGTSLLSSASGEVKVQSRNGRVEIELKMTGLQPANHFGMEYLTYVLWAVSPQGRAVNLGELLLDHEQAKLKATTELQTFGLFVTAEPYFAVTQPSSLVVSENTLNADPSFGEQVQFSYDLLGREAYSSTNARINDAIFGIDPRTPLELFEARNAVRIARNANADKYAADALANAEHALQQAESTYSSRGNKATITTYARDAAQAAEDARVMSVKKQEEERLSREAAEREAQAKAQAAAEAQRAQQAEADRAKAEADRAEAERMRKEAEAEAQQAAQAKAEAEAAQQAAIAQQQQLAAEAQKAQAAAAEADRLRQQAEKEKADLRARLLQQLNSVLETHDTARGLIANMGDVLFETGKYELKPEARERLAKVSGILLAYSSLKVAIEGYTDSTGTENFNQTLSEERANAVRDYFISQGVTAGVVTAQGFGEAQPIASNDTPEGRQKNRRVQLVLSGEAIGTDTTVASSQQSK